ncbi:MAG: sugar nucleotide-binding protein, partial [Candidatus Sumerlaeota bacterium]|nr:sugar nucleotide-binding protein [Candidatus Sumerlaeota bacterium]
MTTLPKILVTGLSGLIGSRLERLAASRYRLVNLDITVGIDITNRAQLLAAIRRHPDAPALIHLAAFTNVSAAHAQQGDREGA